MELLFNNYRVSVSFCIVLWVSLFPCFSFCLQPPSLSSFPSCLPPNFSLPEPFPAAVWGPTQPSHSAHIFNSHLLSLLSPFLAVGHNKQNVRKQKLMSFFKRGQGTSVISFSPQSLTSGTSVTSPNGKLRLLLFNLVGLCSTFHQLKCTHGAKSQQGRQEGCQYVRIFFFSKLLLFCVFEICSRQPYAPSSNTVHGEQRVFNPWQCGDLVG